MNTPWVAIMAKVRFVGNDQIELYHETDTDTGSFLGRMVLPRAAVQSDDDLSEAAWSREDVRVCVELGALLKATNSKGGFDESQQT